MTGYVEGKDTWPYMMLTSLSKMGLTVEAIEIIDPWKMAENPRAEIERVYSASGVVDAILDITDLAAEAQRANDCINDPRVSFVVRTPELDDILRGIRAGAIPIVAVDYGTLHGSGGFEGHFVVVSGIDERQVEIIDPGPPGREGWRVSHEDFQKALHQPSADSGMIMLVGSRRGNDATYGKIERSRKEG